MRFRTPSLLTALVAVLLSLTGSPSAADRLRPAPASGCTRTTAIPKRASGAIGSSARSPCGRRRSPSNKTSPGSSILPPGADESSCLTTPSRMAPSRPSRPFLRSGPSHRRGGAARQPQGDVAGHGPAPRLQDQRTRAPPGRLGPARQVRVVADDSRARRRRGARDPFTVGPILVLTEAGPNQADTFYTRVPAGGRLRLFGTVPPVTFPEATTAEARSAAAFSAPPDRLIPTGATNYRRWTNFPWAVVELGGQNKAGPWTSDDNRRLRAMVSRAHEMGLGAVLHPQRPFGCREQGLDGQLQLRVGRRGTRTHGRSAGCRSRVHRKRPVPRSSAPCCRRGAEAPGSKDPGPTLGTAVTSSSVAPGSSDPGGTLASTFPGAPSSRSSPRRSSSGSGFACGNGSCCSSSRSSWQSGSIRWSPGSIGTGSGVPMPHRWSSLRWPPCCSHSAISPEAS